MNWRLFSITSIAVVFLLVILFMGFFYDPHAVPSVLVNRPAPSFSLIEHQGTNWNLLQNQGKPIVINFWASWCQPCIDELATLAKLSQDYKERITFIGILYQDTTENAQAILHEYSQYFPQLLDHAGLVAIDYGVAGIPESFIIDSKGIIRQKIVGIINPDQLRHDLDILLMSNSTP
ncbi:MAG: TlpA family protein disulfide reductase [Deltaproteobacteria bacterium]|nr:TlpA family protein disulfide reductase [Deltaproteobacteria bacterium]